MRRTLLIIAAVVMLPNFTQAQDMEYNNSEIAEFELSNYLGLWYEIARFDHNFERGMDNVTARYIMRDDGKVDVINTGWKNGKKKVANGKARQPDPKNNPGHLEVSFFLFFYSDYNILMLDDDYQIVLVGSNSPKYLWILARTPEVSDEVVGELLEEAESRGYNTGDLIWVDQSRNL